MLFFFSDRLCIFDSKDDQSEKDTPPGKKKARHLITLEQNMDILRRYDREESTATVRKVLHHPESMLPNVGKDREMITAAIKAAAGRNIQVSIYFYP